MKPLSRDDAAGLEFLPWPVGPWFTPELYKHLLRDRHSYRPSGYVSGQNQHLTLERLSGINKRENSVPGTNRHKR